MPTSVFRDLLAIDVEEKSLRCHLVPMKFSLEGLYHTRKKFKTNRKDSLTWQDSC